MRKEFQVEKYFENFLELPEFKLSWFVESIEKFFFYLSDDIGFKGEILFRIDQDRQKREDPIFGYWDISSWCCDECAKKGEALLEALEVLGHFLIQFPFSGYLEFHISKREVLIPNQEDMEKAKKLVEETFQGDEKLNA